VLAEAIRECKANGCILLVAKLDRLSRNLHFVTALQNSKVDFRRADNPHATPFLIHILVAVAEHERNMIQPAPSQHWRPPNDAGPNWEILNTKSRFPRPLKPARRLPLTVTPDSARRSRK